MSKANELRCVASEIIIRLYEAGETTQLELLHAHTSRAIEELKKRQTSLDEHTD